MGLSNFELRFKDNRKGFIGKRKSYAHFVITTASFDCRKLKINSDNIVMVIEMLSLGLLRCNSDQHGENGLFISLFFCCFFFFL